MKTISVLLLAIGTANAWSQDTFKQADWKPKVGQDTVWSISMKFQAIGQDALFSGKVHEKALNIESDGTVEIESWVEGGVLDFGGSKMEQPSDRVVRKFNSKGEPLQKEDFKSTTDEVFSAYASLRLPESGAKVGDKWDMADPLKRFGKGQAEFSGLSEFAGKQCLTTKLDYTTKNGGSTNGKVYIESESGLLVGFEFSFTKLAIGPGIESDGTASLKLAG